MIRAKIKAIVCSDMPDGDFSAFRPDDPKSFSCGLQLLVGPYHEAGAESFQLTLCTPQWLIDNHPEDNVIVGKNLLIVLEYNYPRIVQWLNRYIERCAGETWQDVAKRVSYIGTWEFDDYIPYSQH